MKTGFFFTFFFLFFFHCSFYFTELLHMEPNLFWPLSFCNIITRTQRKSPLEISNPNRSLFYLQLFEYMTSDNPTANCVPNSNCSHGNFKYREDFPASLQREGSEYLALLGLTGQAVPAEAQPRGHGGTAVPQIHLCPGKLHTRLTPVSHTVTVPSSSQGSATALDYWKDKQLHLGQQPHL